MKEALEPKENEIETLKIELSDMEENFINQRRDMCKLKEGLDKKELKIAELGKTLLNVTTLRVVKDNLINNLKNDV